MTIQKTKQLPKKWSTKKLGEVCEIELGKTPYRGDKSFWDGEKKSKNVWLSIADLLNRQGKIVSDSKEYISDKGAKISKIVKEGTLLVSFKLTLGRLGFAGKDLYTNEAIASLKIKNEKGLSKEFLYYFLTFFDWNKATEGDVKVKGRTLNKSKLKEIKILLPQLTTQKQIVQILDKTFESISKSKENAEKNLKNAKELFESYLEEIFSNPKEDWEEKKLGEVCEIVNGGTPDTKNKDYWDGKNLWITPKDMGKLKDIYVEDTFRKLTDEGIKKSSATILPKNSIILSSRAPIGHLAINTKPMSTNQGCKGIVLSKKCEAKFIYYFLKKSVKLLNDLGSGTTFKELSGTKLSSVNLPLPPLPQQTHIVSKLDGLSKKIKELESIYKQKIKDLEELKKSILKKAFSGELND